ncbi:MAG: selenocysteine-specific translation elongation factor [Clostridium sp.]
MKNIVIGTAGHIDHGKTSLIRAITGRETDTLMEEKNRGISINLGFTFFDLPSNRRAGIIDVPGHEKFVKNMLAGVSGVDIVLLVVAADEGIMPQTKEHFEILQLLNVKKGIIVLTKTDMVDEEWLAMISEDIKEEFRGTFLENSPICAVSSKTKIGIPELIEKIDKLTEDTEGKDVEGHFRLPVDRSFSVSGFGTVVTGTIISGRVKVGDTVEIYPAKIKTKIRSLQIHGKPAEVGEAGQRCAINLANVKTTEVGRGCVVATEEIMEPSMILDCNLYYIKSMEKPLLNRQRVRLYHGTSEILCRVILLDREELKPGETAYVQLRLEEELTVQRNDRYVIRSYSPMYTIGGGSIIEPVSNKVKRFDIDHINEMKIKESGKTENILENTIKNLSSEYPESAQILKALGKNEDAIEEKLECLAKDKRIIKLKSLENPVYVHVSFLKESMNKIEHILLDYHKKNPLKVGISKEELKNKVFGKKIKQKLYVEILDEMQERCFIKVTDRFVYLFNFEITLDKEQERIKELLIKVYTEGRYNTPKLNDVISHEKDKKASQMVFELLLDGEVLIKLQDECIFTKENYDNAMNIVVDYINTNGSIKASDGREIFNSSRKYVVALLENFDSIKLTRRIENERVLY